MDYSVWKYLDLTYYRVLLRSHLLLIVRRVIGRVVQGHTNKVDIELTFGIAFLQCSNCKLTIEDIAKSLKNYKTIENKANDY